MPPGPPPRPVHVGGGSMYTAWKKAQKKPHAPERMGRKSLKCKGFIDRYDRLRQSLLQVFSCQSYECEVLQKSVLFLSLPAP